MYDSYEAIQESDGTFSAKLDGTGMKAYNCKTEEELDSIMASLQVAYEIGFRGGGLDERQRMRDTLGL